jgi:hypothetical protein
VTATPGIVEKDAAIETIKDGFDYFVITSANGQELPGGVYYTPQAATTSGFATAYGPTAYGQSTTTYSGGMAIPLDKHEEVVTVVMFHAGDPNAQHAISARDSLGPDWKKIVSKGYVDRCLQ